VDILFTSLSLYLVFDIFIVELLTAQQASLLLKVLHIVTFFIDLCNMKYWHIRWKQLKLTADKIINDRSDEWDDDTGENWKGLWRQTGFVSVMAQSLFSVFHWKRSGISIVFFM